jgi:hypothetical protein
MSEVGLAEERATGVNLSLGQQRSTKVGAYGVVGRKGQRQDGRGKKQEREREE